jgi:hypothetical protein
VNVALSRRLQAAGPLARVGDVLQRVPAYLLTGGLAATLVGIGILHWGGLLLLMGAVFCAPGIVLLWTWYEPRPGRLLSALTLGPAVGFGTSSLVLLASWLAGYRHLLLVVVAPAVVLGLVWLVRRWTAGLLRPVRLARRDAVCLVLVLSLVPLIVGRPFALVGADLPDGRAYRSYFTSDFVWKMAVVTELAKGDVPPRNQYLQGEPLNYYWLPHLLSAVQLRALSDSVRLDHLLLVNAVWFGMVFMAFLYGFTRQFVPTPGLAALGIIVVLACSSFEGLEQLVMLWRQDQPFQALRGVNIEAVTRWFYGALPIDGLHRLLLYQPQHHAMGYATGLTAMVVLWQARQVTRPAVILLAGTLLGTAVLLSAFSALMIAVMTAPVALWLFWRQGVIAHVLWGGPLMALPMAMAALVARHLEYTADADTLIAVGLHPMAIANFWLTFPMNFGLTLPAAIAAFLWLGLRRDVRAVPLAAVTVVAFGFYFFVNVLDVQDVYVGWRAGHLFFIAAAPLLALALGALTSFRPPARIAIALVTLLLALAAAPTLAIDLYNTQDIQNRSRGPGFRWTIVLEHDELRALRWIQRFTRPSDIVQVEPHSRYPETWAYIPAFAERRMAAGLPLSMVPRERFESASRDVQAVFAADTAQQAFERAVALRINYLYVGGPERRSHPELETMLDAHPRLFPKVFTSAQVNIYQVGRLRRGHEPGTR